METTRPPRDPRGQLARWGQMNRRTTPLRRKLTRLSGLALALATSGCERLVTGEAAAPHARYGRSLGADGAAWRAAADSALARPDTLDAPERLRVRLDTASTDGGVQAWQLAVPRGRVLVVAVAADSSVFVDAFRVDAFRVDAFRAAGTARPTWHDGLATRGAAAGTADTLRIEATGGAEADTVVVRVHARRGHVVAAEVVVGTDPALGFPVAGLDERAVQSRFGADRDGGERRHEGIDVFAPRGTPVVAATDGVASPGDNRLGGTVVWLRDGTRGLSLYYAHLDTALVAPGQRVARGDTLGTVGTTGNARGTAPHLHFGIYGRRADGRGAVDPYPFVARPVAPR